MNGNESIKRGNLALFTLISFFYSIQIIINISIEGLNSIFPPAFLFIVFAIILLLMIYLKINPKITMYAMNSCIYIYFYYLLNDSPYLVNYLFMWLALPLIAIYLNSRVIVISGIASIALTIYTFYNHFYNEVFLSFFKEDFIYLILFGVGFSSLLLVYIYKAKEAKEKLQELAFHDPLTGAGNRMWGRATARAGPRPDRNGWTRVRPGARSGRFMTRFHHARFRRAVARAARLRRRLRDTIRHANRAKPTEMTASTVCTALKEKSRVSSPQMFQRRVARRRRSTRRMPGRTRASERSTGRP